MELQEDIANTAVNLTTPPASASHKNIKHPQIFKRIIRITTHPLTS